MGGTENKLYYFSNDTNDRSDACIAAKNLDYSVLPKKYSILFHPKYPYWLAVILNKIDQYYHQLKK